MDTKPSYLRAFIFWAVVVTVLNLVTIVVILISRY